MKSATTHLTTPDGTRIAYRDHTPPEGRSGRTVLLHGLAGHMGEWDDLTVRLLADGHRVVTYDAIGPGVSTRTPVPSPWRGKRQRWLRTLTTRPLGSRTKNRRTPHSSSCKG